VNRMTIQLIRQESAAMAATTVIDRPVVVDNPTDRVQLADRYQVVLWNDDHNEAGFVVHCLIQVFGHSVSLATKIMFEANNNEKAIAEVEGKESAELHCQQLKSFGLTASVEKI
jgi:ATP-dependent Clp protease adapter protein ClpS